MTRILPLLLVGALHLAPHHALSQEPVDVVLSGRLLLQDIPADTGTVVLHRVTPEEAGTIDSVSVGDDGRFSLSLPHLPVPGSGEVFFASARYEGILYYGGSISEPARLDSLYTIQAFPSAPAPVDGTSLPVILREIWIEEGTMGWWVTDAFIVRHEGPVTLVPGGEGGSVWRYPLPEGAQTFNVIEVGPVRGPVRLEDGMLIASNPLIPGENFYMVQYDLPSLEIDLELPGDTERVQVILRESAPAVRIEGLARQPPAAVEFGEPVLPWAGLNMRDATVRIRLGEEEEARSAVWLAVALTLLLLAGGVWGVAHHRPTRPSPRLRKSILIDLAKLDEIFEQSPDPDDAARARYIKDRRRLLIELEEAAEPASKQ